MTTTALRPDPASPLSTNDHAAGMLATASVGAVSLGAITGVTPDGPVLCPFLAITGLPCPFCGLTRSLFTLGQGDLQRSLEFSPLGVLVAAAAVVVLLVLVRAVVRARGPSWPRPLLVGGALLIATSWIVQLTGGIA